MRQRFTKQLQKVREDPLNIGKPLNSKWFRELKNKSHHIYYLVEEKHIVVLLVGVSDKDTQQNVIDAIKKQVTHLRIVLQEDRFK